jgi:Na+-transporting NADH:ubiquinone oxidoreductase subunit NqrC
MPIFIVVVILIAGIVVLLAFPCVLRRKRQNTAAVPEAILLEEAVVTEPVAPGMEGKARICKRGLGTFALRVRATDASQAFARGAKVRVIDLRDGLCIVESADEEHLVR